MKTGIYACFNSQVSGSPGLAGGPPKKSLKNPQPMRSEHWRWS